MPHLCHTCSRPLSRLSPLRTPLGAPASPFFVCSLLGGEVCSLQSRRGRLLLLRLPPQRLHPREVEGLGMAMDVATEEAVARNLRYCPQLPHPPGSTLSPKP